MRAFGSDGMPGRGQQFDWRPSFKQVVSGTPVFQIDTALFPVGGPGHTAAAIGLGTVWVWGGTGCASQGDSSWSNLVRGSWFPTPSASTFTA
eukprot:873033-Pelagomonas_calceolata.AAC.1